MTGFSTDQAWRETQARLKTDASLLLPVAFAFQALPTILFQYLVLQPRMEAWQASGGTDFAALSGNWGLWGIPVAILGMIGSIALVLLVNRPGTSVGEALSLGARRTPFLLVAAILLGLAFGVAAFLVGVIGGLTGSQGVMALLFLLMLPVLIFFSIRLSLLYATAAMEPIGPVALLRRTWALTRGNFWKLFALFVLFVVVSIVVTMFLSSLVGIPVALATGGQPGALGNLIVLIVAGLGSTVVSAIGTVMIARIYAQLAGEDVEQDFR